VIGDLGSRIADRIRKTQREFMDQAELKKRTKSFALRIINLVESLPRKRTADVIGKQLLRCGTSVGANYRASNRAKSRADFVFKLSIVEEECDESLYWMELLVEAGVVKERLLQPLMKEADEILSIMVASIVTARSKISQRSPMSKRSPIRDPQFQIR
jgi:four helix bundle protein